MKKILSLIALLFIAIMLNAQVEPKDTDGNGYRNISTLEHLRWISENSLSWAENFELDNDIDAMNTKNWNNGKGFSPIGNSDSIYFYGVFNGNGYSVNNLFINRPEQKYIGLFGYILGEGCAVKNLATIDCNITGYMHVGGLIGHQYTSIVSNCYSTGKTNGIYEVGALIGYTQLGLVSNCYSIGEAFGIENVGGFVGWNSSMIIRSYSIGVVNGKEDVGGFVGINWGIVVDCFWDIQTSGQDTSSGGTGKTTFEMKTKSTYTSAGWNYLFIWNGNTGYPYININMNYRPSDSDNDGSLNIKTLTDLRWLSESSYDADKNWELDNDIDAKASINWNNGMGFVPIPYFTGKFDGKKHIIDNLYIDRPDSFIGLFAYMYGANSRVQNLGITNCNISAHSSIGAIVGKIVYANVLNCYSTGTIEGTFEIGGLVGYNSYGIISNCFSSVNIIGREKIGGLVGSNSRGIITNNYSTGNITGYEGIGGLVGENIGTIANCYSTGSVNANKNVGGLVGENISNIISNCYSTGIVIGNKNVGGLVGYNNRGGTISNSFWDTQTSGQDSSAGGTGKITTEMQKKSTFINTNWNFDFIWAHNEGYPYINIDMNYRPSDTDNDGFLNIRTLDDLRWLSESAYDLDGNWELDNDINATDTKNWNGSLGFFPIPNFTGVFDGNSYKISNLFINRVILIIGFFNSIYGHKCEIKNLGITDCNIKAYSYAGGLVGENRFATVSNCYSSGCINGLYRIGGLIGENFSGSILHSYSEAKVEGKSYVGGLIGDNVFGIVWNNYSTGSVSGDNYIGGLAGSSYFYEILNCYSVGEVKGTTFSGGLLGKNYGTAVINSFWDTQTSGIDTSKGGFGKNTTEMKTKSTFTNATWDFNKIWNLASNINNGYPYLDSVPVTILEERVKTNNKFSIFPNPIFKGKYLNIRFIYPIMNYTIKIYNNKGILVAQVKNQQVISIPNCFGSGTYFIVVESKRNLLGTEKFIVK